MEPVERAIDEFRARHRTEIEDFLTLGGKHPADYGKLKQTAPIDCEWVSKAAGLHIQKQTGLKVALRKGTVLFRDSPPCTDFPNFHAWLEVPGKYAVIDYTIGYYLRFEHGDVVLSAWDDWHPVRSATLEVRGLVFAHWPPQQGRFVLGRSLVTGDEAWVYEAD